LGIVEVLERDGSYVLSGPGRGGEPAVQMRRLPANGMLPALLGRGEADARLMRRIARRPERFHRRAATGPDVDEYGALDPAAAPQLVVGPLDSRGDGTIPAIAEPSDASAAATPEAVLWA
jgi:aminoglycoside phosphotransferase family enzyme